MSRACELGAPALRPMPGPPEHRRNAHPHGDGSDGWCPICHHLHARRPDGSNRLTDAECEAEWDHAEESASTCHLLAALGDKRVTAWQLERQANAADTWHRFATHPHALEVTA